MKMVLNIEKHKTCCDCKYYDGLFCSKDLFNHKELYPADNCKSYYRELDDIDKVSYLESKKIIIKQRLRYLKSWIRDESMAVSFSPGKNYCKEYDDWIHEEWELEQKLERLENNEF